MNTRTKHPEAIARIKGNEDAPQLSGTVEFYQKKSGVLVLARITGLPKNSKSGFFAFHIHEGKSCTGEGFSDTMRHYNPKETNHPDHAGDLPPLLANHWDAYLAVMTDRISVKEVIGKTVVIHQNPDDFTTQPSGNAGKKIACGVIKKVR